MIIFTQLRLVNIAENVSNKLSYFNELEWVSTKLNSPTLSVASDSFVVMLTRLDECISFLEQNVSYIPRLYTVGSITILSLIY